ncbi:hypothetical protein AQUCO_01300481v1 [Aquilegia coerulea]|uniref:PGR5-like protein 1A, chloroplastic n=1 Tax=Aquilegia coerulea TaxID=218851 RepID=A0A2G5E1Y3_AQUCA|nr:hypothetical protein AQUCO_01300481v1 [Aquilegia coerulea]
MVTQLGFPLTSPRLLFAPLNKPIVSLSSSSSPNCSRIHFNPSVQLISHKLYSRRRIFITSPKATEQEQGQVQGEDVVDSNIMPYCSIEKQRKSLGEMEQDFLLALQSFYYEGKATMSNEEFDNLKEELMWEGSSVVMLSSDEQKFLEASMAYVSGNPILTDKEFDDLKLRLKVCSPNIFLFNFLIVSFWVSSVYEAFLLDGIMDFL